MAPPAPPAPSPARAADSFDAGASRTAAVRGPQSALAPVQAVPPLAPPGPINDLLDAALRCPLSGVLLTQAMQLRDGRSYQDGPVLQARLQQGAHWPPPAAGSSLDFSPVPNFVMRQICQRVAAGEQPTLAWPELRCALSLEVLVKPTVNGAGQTYSAAALYAQLQHGGGLSTAKDPLTRAPMRNPLTNQALEGVLDVLLAANLPLHVAALRDTVQALPAAAVRAECLRTDAQGQTVLHLAAKYGKLRAARHLLKLGVPVAACDGLNQTALKLAVERCHMPVVRALAAPSGFLSPRQHRAFLNQADQFDESALMVAALINPPQSVALLCQAGAHVDLALAPAAAPPHTTGARNPHAHTALQLAVLYGSEAGVRELVRLGANPNEPRGLYAQRSPMGMAVAQQQWDLMRIMTKRR